VLTIGGPRQTIFVGEFLFSRVTLSGIRATQIRESDLLDVDWRYPGRPDVLGTSARLFVRSLAGHPRLVGAPSRLFPADRSLRHLVRQFIPPAPSPSNFDLTATFHKTLKRYFTVATILRNSVLASVFKTAETHRMSNSIEFPDTSEYICTTRLMTGFVRGKRCPCLLIPAIG
jgi:hypothetical protein